MLTLNDGRSELWQWDTSRKLTVDADCTQVHFSNKVFGRSIDMPVIDGVVEIPDFLLQTDKDLTAWAFVGTAENGYTKISKVFKVNKRNKPADYVFTPPEQTTLEEIKEKLDYLESIQDPDAIKNAVDEYLANNPIQIDEKDPTVPDWAKQTTKPKYTATEVGAVAKVNGKKPDANGNVKIEVSGGNADQPTEYFLLKSPNGTVYKVTVTDSGTLKVIGETDIDLPGLIPGRLLVWNDEFDGDSVDLNKWYFRKFGFDGTYANPNATVHDSMLDLCVTKDATGNISGNTMLMTNGRAEFKYGRMEARMKFDRNFHTAFWCVGQTQTQYNGAIQGKTWCYSGEIDIYEPIETGVYATLHWGTEDKSVHNSERAGEIEVDFTAWHTYAVEWTETEMVFYCDDSVIGTIENLNELKNPDGFKPFNAPHYMILQAMSNANTVEGEYHCYVDWVRYYAPESVSSLIDVQTLTLSETEMSLNPNRVKELELTISPDYVTDYTLVWESDNTEVATFAGGNRVTSIGNGTANLTVTAKNGVSAKCVLTVSDDAYNPATEIVIYGATENSFAVGESVQLEAVVFPKWATYLEVDWETSDATVATVTDGLVQFVGGGDVTITAKDKGNSGVYASVQFAATANVVDNIQTENAVIKFTRKGWNQTVDGGFAWASDIDGIGAISGSPYVGGCGYNFNGTMNTTGSNVFDTGFNFSDDYTIAARLMVEAGAKQRSEGRFFELHSSKDAEIKDNPRLYFSTFATGNHCTRAYNADGTAAINLYNKSTGIALPAEETTYINAIFVHEENGNYKVYVSGAEVDAGVDSVQMPDTLAYLSVPCNLSSINNASEPQKGYFQAFVAYNAALTVNEVAALNTALDEMYA